MSWLFKIVPNILNYFVFKLCYSYEVKPVFQALLACCVTANLLNVFLLGDALPLDWPNEVPVPSQDSECPQSLTVYSWVYLIMVSGFSCLLISPLITIRGVQFAISKSFLVAGNLR